MSESHPESLDTWLAKPGKPYGFRLSVARTISLGYYESLPCRIQGEVRMTVPTVQSVRPIEDQVVFTFDETLTSTVPVWLDFTVTMPENVDASVDARSFLTLAYTATERRQLNNEITVTMRTGSGRDKDACVIPDGERSRWHGYTLGNQWLKMALYDAAPGSKLRCRLAHVVTGELLPHVASFEGRVVREDSVEPGADTCSDLGPMTARPRKSSARRVYSDLFQNAECEFASVTGFKRNSGTLPYI